MLKSLRIKNFKAWKDTGEIRLAPLTVLFGANSAGKSSIGHLIQALKQTAESTDRYRSLHIGDQNSPIDLGTFEDCLHNHELKEPLEFSLKWDLFEKIEVADKLQNYKFQGNTLSLNAIIGADIQKQAQTNTVNTFCQITLMKSSLPNALKTRRNLNLRYLKIMS
jgi:AAA15 family ATPase/GTPase